MYNLFYTVQVEGRLGGFWNPVSNLKSLEVSDIGDYREHSIGHQGIIFRIHRRHWHEILDRQFLWPKHSYSSLFRTLHSNIFKFSVVIITFENFEKLIYLARKLRYRYRFPVHSVINL
jgi:hypothetical protein